MHDIATLALLAATGAGLYRVGARAEPEPLAAPLSSINLEEEDIGGWRFVADQQLPAPAVRALKPSGYLARVYRKHGAALDVLIAYYAQQRSGESMHSPKHCLPGAGWEIWKHGTADAGAGITINKYSISHGAERLLMFYWYQSRDRVVAGELEAKLLLARDTLLTGYTAGSLVRFTLPDTESSHREGPRIAARLTQQMRRCLSGSGPSTVAAR